MTKRQAKKIEAYTRVRHDLQASGADIWYHDAKELKVVAYVTSKVRRSSALKARQVASDARTRKFYRVMGL